jgi:hypothetical protein
MESSTASQPPQAVETKVVIAPGAKKLLGKDELLEIARFLSTSKRRAA